MSECCGENCGNCWGEASCLKIGHEVPEVSFEFYHDNAFKKGSLADYHGKWTVVFFYPADFTFVCPTELEELADNYAEFTSRNAEVLSVSTDTVFTHKAWKDHSKAIGKVTYPMVADPTHEISKLFGVYLEDEGVALRGTFVIDPDGVLQAMEVHSNNIGRSAGELLRKLDAAIFVREHGGEVCPASWVKGKDTLRPGIDLVGKI